MIRRLGIRLCGAFGGIWSTGQRWCIKPFGHSDSCAFDLFPDSPIGQPGWGFRQRCKGWPT